MRGGASAVGRHAVRGCGELEFGQQSPSCSGQHRDHHGADPVGDGVAGEHEDRPVAVGRMGEPGVTSAASMRHGAVEILLAGSEDTCGSPFYPIAKIRSGVAVARRVEEDGCRHLGSGV